MREKKEKKIFYEDWHEVFGLERRCISIAELDTEKMLRIPGHTFLKF